MKYILIWEYHDTNFEVFFNKADLVYKLNQLKHLYKGDRDFRYFVYYGYDHTEDYENNN